MANDGFRFKRFMVNQEDCSMKVGTDGVLLGAWFPASAGMSVLDVGSGTGLIALMAAQRGAGQVTAIEIDASAAAQAARNAAASEWAGKIQVVASDIADYHTDARFDRILSNPPYFRDSLRSPDAGRNAARHNDRLSYETLVSCSIRLLAPGGLLCVVLPFDAADEFVRCSLTAGLYLARRTDVVTVQGREPKRSLLSFSTVYIQPRTDVLNMREADGNESAQYVNLVRDFYLKY